MEFNYNVEVPKSDVEEINELHDFAEDGDKVTMQVIFDDEKIAISRRSVLAKVISRSEYDMDIKRIGSSVYISKR